MLGNQIAFYHMNMDFSNQPNRKQQNQT